MITFAYSDVYFIKILSIEVTFLRENNVSLLLISALAISFCYIVFPVMMEEKTLFDEILNIPVFLALKEQHQKCA